MKFTAISIQGNIVSGDILTKISQDDIRYQKQADFGLDAKTTVRDEIGIAWHAAQSHWNAFKLRRDRLKEDATGTSETRRSWIIPLLLELGYELETAKAEILNDKTYAISHRAVNRGVFPVHIVGVNQELDKRAEFGARLSPHALMQEYLNNNEHLYGICTNGRFIRLLRDATRLSRLSYLEFDLERMMEEELYAEFAVFFRLMHITRMPETQDSGAESIIEYYHQEALSSGSRIREKLSEAVEESLKKLANGILAHPHNEELRENIADGNINAKIFYLYLLRSIYRILFLMVIEERHLIYPAKLDEETQKKRKIYYDFYSVQRLTKLAERNIYVDPRKTDLWCSLLTTFSLFEWGKFGKKLGIEPLGSGLFSPDAIGLFATTTVYNEHLLAVIRKLILFENENKHLSRVNYADLDVEEFGSVYEGLLEFEPSLDTQGNTMYFQFEEGSDRSSSGSHYTPEELVKPLIKHSLDYIIQDRLNVTVWPGESEFETMRNQADALLTITVCDVACGSGHILLSAARRIGFEVAVLRESIDSRSKVEQTSPTYLRAAIRDVIRNCIYGVDLNPLAVELCKVALWLEAHTPGEPLNFLDHHIKNGNAIVGLAHVDELKNGIPNEAFKTLKGDNKSLAQSLRKVNAKQRDEAGQLTAYRLSEVDDTIKGIQKEFSDFSALPEQTPEEITRKEQAYKKLTVGNKWYRLESLADVQVAQFFIPKTLENKPGITLDSQFRTYLNTNTQILDRGLSTAAAAEHRFFHWFLEFPTVFSKGGFDCILGNPPFLGGQKLTGTYGNAFAHYVKFAYAPIGSVDLVTYFFRRIFTLIKKGGFQSLISTNTIAQGDARQGGLAVILEKNGVINHAVRSMKWPGLAAVEVALVTLYKGGRERNCFLDKKEVAQITSYLDDTEPLGDPFPLKANDGKSFQGSIVLGKGFVLTPKHAQELIRKNPKNKDVLFPYLNGDDLNNQVDQRPTRWVINFFDWPLKRYSQEEWSGLAVETKENINHRLQENKAVVIAPHWFGGKVAADYQDCLTIVERDVKPERLSKQGDRGAQYWWQFLRIREELYSTIAGMERVLVVARISRTVAIEFCKPNIVFADAIVVFPFSSSDIYGLLQSTINNNWAWNYCTTMKSDLNYSPTKTFDTFPFPYTFCSSFRKTVYEYVKKRNFIRINVQLGLTKTYNQFHNQDLIPFVEDLESKKFTKKYGKETWNLYNHLEVKKEGKISYKEAVPLIFELRELHKQMDEAVLEAYGWHEDSEKWGKAIKLRHGFYEVEYLPENDRVRYTIHPEARKEVLKRLLLLNHERFEEEVKEGLHKKKDVEAYFKQKGKPVPAGTTFSDRKTKAKKPSKKSKSTNTPDLFS